MVTGDDKKEEKSEFDILKKMSQSYGGSKAFSGKSGQKSKGLFWLWVIMIGVIFVIVPFIIGMFASGYVDLTGDIFVTFISILTSIIVIIIGVYL